MEIRMADVRYCNKNGLDSRSVEGVRHTKVLPYLSVVQAVEGEYEIALGREKPVRTGTGGFFIAPSDVRQTIVHRVDRESGRMRARWIFLDLRINKAYSLDELYTFPTVPTGELKRELSALFDRLFATDGRLAEYALCYELADLLVRHAASAKHTEQDGLADAMAYMTGHFSESLTVARLAEVARMSEPSFYRRFRERFDLSPIAYLNCYRLSVAANMLSDTDETVKAICASVGVYDPLYFSRAFKKVYGMSPKAYRAAYKKQIPI